MHQRNSGQDIVRFATRFDAKEPNSLRWTDMAHQPWRAREAAVQMLPPVEWSVERPRLAVSNVKSVSLADH